MSKFNQVGARPAVTSPIQTERIATAVNHQGGDGFGRDKRSELYLLAVANTVGESTFYEKAGDRDERFEGLVREVTRDDPRWMLNFVRWLRADGNMRSASIVAACHAVKERTDHYAAVEQAHISGERVRSIRMSDPHDNAATSFSRAIIDAALLRADEPGELLAYWKATFGRAIPKPVKRGVADAVQRLYTERSLLKYDTASHGHRFGDVIELVHPSPAADKPWQGELFQFAIERRRDRVSATVDSSRLRTVIANSVLSLDASEDPSVLLDADRLSRAGMTWEDAFSLAGNRLDKAKLWESLIPSMGVMALARNLRNFDEAGVSDEAAALVLAKFADPEQISRSRMFPFRWLAAYRHAPSLRWGHALDQALTASLSNVPALGGRTLVLIDRSPSMFPGYGFSTPNKSDISLADQAAVFGVAVAMRAASATLAVYGGTSREVKVVRGGSLLKAVDGLGPAIDSTDTAAAVRAHYAGHSRVIIVTDEQTGGMFGRGDVTSSVPAHVPVYTWNLAGYEHGHAPSGSGQRHTFGGLTDAAWGLIPLLENARPGAWPWDLAAAAA